MLLMIDVGNTNTVIGVSDTSVEIGEIRESWRISSDRQRMSSEWYSLLKPLLESRAINIQSFAGIVISSVVPAITMELNNLSRRFFALEPLVVSSQLDLGITIDVDAPSEVGADRLVNCAGAFALLGGPTIVIDLGTATKIEAISMNGDYLGGVIAPGLGLTLDALAGRAARLYAVELRLPQRAIGRNTVAAVQSGVVFGHTALIEGIVAKVKEELGGANHVVLTGGLSPAIVDGLPCVTDHIPDLTLRGLRIVYERNAPAR